MRSFFLLIISLSAFVAVTNILIHIHRWLITTCFADHFRRHTCDGRTWRHFLKHNRTSSHAAAMPYFDVTQHLGSCPDQDAIANLGMAVLFLFAGPTKRHRMQHRNVVTHHSSLANHNGMCVVDHNAFANLGGWVNVDAKDLTGAHLDEVGQVRTPLAPQPIADAIGLHRLITFKIEDRLQQTMTRRITIVDRAQISPCRFCNLRI
mmetsp:Transcript_17/g.32  ORF Transcript_17/g.32 Transcript_17/m.32 type:complete len:206 (-) Transcript_17:350-967(-)